MTEIDVWTQKWNFLFCFAKIRPQKGHTYLFVVVNCPDSDFGRNIEKLPGKKQRATTWVARSHGLQRHMGYNVTWVTTSHGLQRHMGYKN
jgi:hypothetical protein